MVDGEQDVDIVMGDSLADVWVTHPDAPTFALRRDPTLLKLRPDECSNEVRWPRLNGIKANVVTDGATPSVAASLVAALLDAGADSVREFDVVQTVPCLVRTHVGGRS